MATANRVSVNINGIQLSMTLMKSKFPGTDFLTKERFSQGAQIAYISSNFLTQEQRTALFGQNKPANSIVVQFPLREAKEIIPPEPKKSNFTPSEYQQAIKEALLTTNHHLLIEALAGSGKTSTLVWLVEQLAELGMTKSMSIIYLAFNKSIQEELTERLIGTNVPALTTHSFGFRLLKNNFGNITLRSGKIRELFVSVLCDEFSLPYDENGIDVVKKSNEYRYRSNIKKLAGFIKNWAIFPDNGFSKEQKEVITQFLDIYNIGIIVYDKDGKPKKNPSPEEIAYYKEKVVDWACQAVLRSIPKPGQNLPNIDYDDMLYLPMVLNLTMPKYDLILTDESQDFNKCQILMLERMAA